MPTINFYLDKADKKGCAPIHLRINSNGSQIKVATGEKINPNDFDKNTQLVAANSEKALEINHYLNFLRERANELLNHPCLIA